MESVTKVSNSRDEITCSRFRWEREEVDVVTGVGSRREPSANEVALEDDLCGRPEKLELTVDNGGRARATEPRAGRPVLSGSGSVAYASSERLLSKVVIDAEEIRLARF